MVFRVLFQTLLTALLASTTIGAFAFCQSVAAQNIFDSLQQKLNQTWNQNVNSTVDSVVNKVMGKFLPGAGQGRGAYPQGGQAPAGQQYPVGGQYPVEGQYPGGGQASGGQQYPVGGQFPVSDQAQGGQQYPVGGQEAPSSNLQYPSSPVPEYSTTTNPDGQAPARRELQYSTNTSPTGTSPTVTSPRGVSLHKHSAGSSSSFGPRQAEPVEYYPVGSAPSLGQLKNMSKTAPNPNVLKVPQGFPFSVYPDGRLTESRWDKSGAVVEFKTLESASRLTAYYMNELKSQDWYINSGGMSTPFISSIRAMKNGQKTNVFVRFDNTIGMTVVRIVMLFHPDD